MDILPTEILCYKNDFMTIIDQNNFRSIKSCLQQMHQKNSKKYVYW